MLVDTCQLAVNIEVSRKCQLVAKLGGARAAAGTETEAWSYLPQDLGGRGGVLGTVMKAVGLLEHKHRGLHIWAQGQTHPGPIIGKRPLDSP